MDSLQAVRRMRACLGIDNWNMGLMFVEAKFRYQFSTKKLTHLLPNVPSIESDLLQVVVAAAGALHAQTSGRRIEIAHGPSRTWR